MGNSAARRAARFFALPEMVTQTENVYLELLGKDLVSSAPEDTRAVS